MKKKRLPIIVASSVVLITLLTFVFVMEIDKFDEHSLQTLRAQMIEQDGSLPVGKEFAEPLTGEQKASLASALASGSTAKTRGTVDQQYSLALENRWGRTKHYLVTFTDDRRVFLQERGNQGESAVSYELQDPQFFYQHAGFQQIYRDRLQPDMQLTLNDQRIPYQPLEIVWEYEKFDNQWVTLEDKSQKSERDGDGQAVVKLKEDVLAVSIEKAPDAATLQITQKISGQVVYDDVVSLEHLPFPDANGEYEYHLAMQWSDQEAPYRGSAVLSFSVEFALPETFVFSNDKLVQGDMLEVAVYNADKLENLLFEQSVFPGFRWYEDQGVIRGYIPTNYSTKPGSYEIRYGNKQTGVEQVQSLRIVEHEYHIQHLTIDEKIEQSTQNDEAYAEFAKYFTPVRKQSNPQRYYTESFMIPTHGRLTTEFGQTRYVNGSPTSSRHSGLDIAAPQGTEIVASNRGKVVLSMPLILTGNTIVIDHGEGLFSVYYHMYELVAEAGEIVERGQVIGTVGTTGFSTGPHLHFMISYYDMNMEPGFFMVGTPITFTNYREYLQ